MKWLHPYPKEHNLFLLTPRKPQFEEAYLAARTLEYRLYSDDVVRQLPYLKATHPQANEWALRQANTERLLAQLSTLSANNKVLDLGCGNGWFTQRIAHACSAQVLGTDINERELIQAARLFSTDNCHFAYGDIFEHAWPESYFDVIILNSCIQYFPSLVLLLNRLQLLINKGGVIHILDSPIYDQTALEAAQKRTKNYYQKQGVSAMSAHYHHHSWKDLKNYDHNISYDPTSLINRIKRKILKNHSPFPWVEIHQRTIEKQPTYEGQYEELNP